MRKYTSRNPTECYYNLDPDRNQLLSQYVHNYVQSIVYLFIYNTMMAMYDLQTLLSWFGGSVFIELIKYAKTVHSANGYNNKYVKVYVLLLQFPYYYFYQNKQYLSFLMIYII